MDADKPSGSGQSNGEGSVVKVDLSKYPAKDVRMLLDIMRSVGIRTYNPQAAAELLDFVYKYVTRILEDAQVYADYVKKGYIDLSDVRLSHLLQKNRTLNAVLPKEKLQALAAEKNSIPLPPVRSSDDIRLPPDEDSLDDMRCHIQNTLFNMPSECVTLFNMPSEDLVPKVDMDFGSLLMPTAEMDDLYIKGDIKNFDAIETKVIELSDEEKAKRQLEAAKFSDEILKMEAENASTDEEDIAAYYSGEASSRKRSYSDMMYDS